MFRIASARRRLLVAVSVFLASGTAIAAPKYTVEFDGEGLGAAPVEQPLPAYPDDVRKGQEAWVRVSFVVEGDGRVADPVVIDSAGGGAFEQAAIDAVSRWRFEADALPAGASRTVDLRFELERGKDRASNDFLRRYRDAATSLIDENYEKAREQADRAADFGGWNLYEATILELLLGRLDDAEGRDAANLRRYRRAVGIGNAEALKGQARRDVLARIFEIEYETGQYGAALETWDRLVASGASGDQVEALAEKKADIDGKIAAGETVTTVGTLSGRAPWSYAPLGRSFSFASVDGNVESFEARCDNHRVGAVVKADNTWTLPESWGDCRVFVFGEDGASFELVEPSAAEGDAGDPALAIGDVLDKRDSG